MQWINSITSTAIACSGVLFFSTDYFALLRKSTADGNTHTDGMWHLEGMMGREDGKGNILTFLYFLLCLYTSLWALPSSSSPPDSLVPTNSHINNNPLETPFFYPTAFCCVLLLPILTLIHRVCVCVCVCVSVCVYFLCKFSQDAQKMLEKIKTKPSWLYHIFCFDNVFKSSSWSLFTFHCPMAAAPKLTHLVNYPVSTCTSLHSQDNLSLATEEIHARMPHLQL